MSDTLFIIDGYNIIFRAYFAFSANPLRNDRGENTSAIFGFLRTIASLIREYRPSELCVVLDPLSPTFRHQRYPEYKGTRERTPEDLKAQFPRIEAILKEMRLPTLRIEGYEADDVIASMVRVYTQKHPHCVIVSADKDLMQLIDDSVTMLRPSKRGFERINADGVREIKGVRADQIGDYLALVGDSSDNIPGVSGIGDKTAVKLLAEYQTLENIYAQLDGLPAAQAKKLIAGKEKALLSRELVTLIDTLEVIPPDGGYPLAIQMDSAVALLKKENIHSLVVEYRQLIGQQKGAGTPARGEGKGDGSEMGDAEAGAAPNAAPDGARDAKASAKPDAAPDAKPDAAPDGSSDASARTGVARDTLDLIPADDVAKYADRYELVTSVERLAYWMEKVRAHGMCAFDTETTSLDPMRAEPVGLSFAVADHHACYIPLVGPDGPVMDAEIVRSRVKPALEDPEIKIIGQNIKYDMNVMANWGVAVRGVSHDTMIAAWLLDTTAFSYKLDVLAQKYLNYRAIPFPESAKKEGFASIELSQACMYAAEDADIAYALHLVFDPMLKQRSELYALYTDVEMALVPILSRMERSGIKIDPARLATLEAHLNNERDTIKGDIFHLSGEEYNINSTKTLQRILFTKLGLSPIKKTKTGFSTDTSVLTLLATQHPLPEKILTYRMLTKLLTTYVKVLPELIHKRSGRIHTTFSLIGTSTGRISSANPNLQNIPIKDEQGKKIRAAFVPEKGFLFVSADYSQIELVVFTHLSQDRELLAAFADDKDVHALTAALIFGCDIAAVDAAQRRMAKTINFGVMYGMSAFRLARELGITQEKARLFIEQYFIKYAGVRKYIDATLARARQSGYVQTLLGRRRSAIDLNSANKNVRQGAERVVINAPIQGSAADIIKLAMKNVYRAFTEAGLRSRLLLQVHDELVVEALASEQQQVTDILSTEMTTAYPLSVPLRVHISSGNDWGALK